MANVDMAPVSRSSLAVQSHIFTYRQSDFDAWFILRANI